MANKVQELKEILGSENVLESAELLEEYSKDMSLAPQVKPPPKAERMMLSPSLSLFSHSHKHNGIVAAVVFPYR